MNPSHDCLSFFTLFLVFPSRDYMILVPPVRIAVAMSLSLSLLYLHIPLTFDSFHQVFFFFTRNNLFSFSFLSSLSSLIFVLLYYLLRIICLISSSSLFSVRVSLILSSSLFSRRNNDILMPENKWKTDQGIPFDISFKGKKALTPKEQTVLEDERARNQEMQEE